MDIDGLSIFSLYDESKTLLEQQTVQHLNTCVDNFSEGEVQGLYFGGTCRAPIDVVVTYS
jgi:hypothetical protein